VIFFLPQKLFRKVQKCLLLRYDLKCFVPRISTAPLGYRLAWYSFFGGAVSLLLPRKERHQAWRTLGLGKVRLTKVWLGVLCLTSLCLTMVDGTQGVETSTFQIYCVTFILLRQTSGQCLFFHLNFFFQVFFLSFSWEEDKVIRGWGCFGSHHLFNRALAKRQARELAFSMALSHVEGLAGHMQIGGERCSLPGHSEMSWWRADQGGVVLSVISFQFPPQNKEGVILTRGDFCRQNSEDAVLCQRKRVAAAVSVNLSETSWRRKFARLDCLWDI